MKLNYFVYFIFFSLLFQSCYFGDNPSGTKRVKKDFCTTWFENRSDLKLIKCDNDKISGNGTLIIEETVFAIGSNENFIIAKQHPNKKKEIVNRLTQRKYIDEAEYFYLLPDLRDTIWLQKKDSIFKIDSVWCHKDYIFEHLLPDTLKPYKAITNYYIIDIQNYSRSDYNSYTLFKFDNENDFNKKRIELNINDTLKFEVINPKYL